MTTQTILDANREVLRLVATTKTTPNSDYSVKPINTDSTTIEILVFEAIIYSNGSQFGHVAIDIDGVIYTRAHSKYSRILIGKLFRDSNQKFRDFEGLVLRVSPDEKNKIKLELERRIKIDKQYDIIDNSCSTNIADVLETIGILAHDPRFQVNPESTNLVSPKEILIIVSRSKRMSKRNHYSKIN